MSEWKRVKFFELFSEPTKNGIYKTKEFHGNGAKIINMGEIFAYAFIGKQDMNRVELNGKERNSFLVNNGDLLFARRSLVESGAGKCSIVYGLSEETTFESSIIRVRLDERIAYPLYYMYWMRSLKGRTAINGIVSGVNVKGIRSSDLQNIDVDFPPLDTQHRIATILSRYDSLIENYQKQITLLEESAQRLYKEWFIDFRFPGHENTKIVDGVPEGWEKKKIGDISKTTSGGTPSRTNNSFYSGSIMWVKTKELCDGFILGTEEKITEEAIKKSSAKIVPAGSILMAMYGATIGKLGIATKDLTCNQACCVFLISEDNPLRWYIFNWLLQNRNFLISQGKGAAQPNLSQDMIKGFELIIPDDKSLRGYHLLINPIYLNIKSLQSQICQLTEARNRLLPKLMSGEIEV